jgi:hypothetical protein
VIQKNVCRDFRARPNGPQSNGISIDEDLFPSGEPITGQGRPAIDDNTPGLNQAIDFAT